MAFSYKRPITIDHTKVSATLADFPVWVSVTSNDLRTVSNGGHVQHASGYDIYLYTDEALTTPITTWDRTLYNASTGALAFHVKIASLSSSVDTVLWMAYGDASISAQQWVTASTWTSGYTAVHHLNQDPSGTAPQITDVTGNGNNGTSGGSMTTGDLVSGPLGSAIDFDGTNDYIAIANTANAAVYSRTSPYSLSAWVKGPSGQAGKFAIMMAQIENITDVLVSMGSLPAGGSKMSVYIRGNSNPVNHRATTSDVWDNNWHHITWTDNVGDLKIYVDGIQDATNFSYTPPTVLTTNMLTLGALRRTSNPTGTGFMICQLAESRFSTVVRSAAWIATEYANQNSVGTFLTLGSETPAGPGKKRRIWVVL